ncbi:ATP-binding protein [Rhizobium ruizarguesonis]
MSEPVTVEKQSDLSKWLQDPVNEGLVVMTHLNTSERVIARVTDGIYRSPASALRELISNAWDADASDVTILTDAPRFSRIYIRDNGIGMNHETLARLLKNIGGSAKRREEGSKAGITNPLDFEKTPSGRPLIGKIGIGLFSISQISRRFQIITKMENERYRLIAEIKLRAYAEGQEDQAEETDDYLSGEVLIRREHSDDIGAHGTDIILDDVKPRVRDILRSADRWQAVAERQAALQSGDIDTYVSTRVEAPVYHTGFIEKMSTVAEGPMVLSTSPALPWEDTVPPAERMAKLLDAVEGEFTRLDRPDLANTLDAYLEMLWSLALSAPVPYVDKHPFDLTRDDNVQLYWITRERGRGTPVNLDDGETVRDAVKAKVEGHPALEAGRDPIGKFEVVIDGVQLKRPIRFKHRQADPRGLAKSVLFVGKFHPNLDRIAEAQRGGELSLDGYLFWTGRVVPKENAGVLVRIREASGALFDPTFLKYQVSEQTRLRQITSELFVHCGLDAALNLDRESFNFAHPHTQLVTLWFHNAIRQLTNRLKDEGTKLRDQRRDADAQVNKSLLMQNVERKWHERKGTEPLPGVLFTEDPSEANRARLAGTFAILRSGLPKASSTSEQFRRDAKATALAQVLSAYDVFEGRSYNEQQEIISAIIAIFEGEDR